MTRRIVVVGTTGAGKTTLARSVAARLDLPHIELDALYWQPEWQPTPRERFRARVAEAVSGERWVLDGNYSTVRDLVWPRAQLLVWLDYSFALVMARLLRRTLRRVGRQEALWGGNRERLRMAFFSRQSILWWGVTTYHRRRRDYVRLLADPEYAHLFVLRFRTPGATERWLQSLDL